MCGYINSDIFLVCRQYIEKNKLLSIHVLVFCRNKFKISLAFAECDTLPKTRYLMVPNSCDTINVPCSHIENYYCPPDPPPPTICCIIPLQPKAVLNCSFRVYTLNYRIVKISSRNQWLCLMVPF